MEAADVASIGGATRVVVYGCKHGILYDVGFLAEDALRNRAELAPAVLTAVDERRAHR